LVVFLWWCIIVRFYFSLPWQFVLVLLLVGSSLGILTCYPSFSLVWKWFYWRIGWSWLPPASFHGLGLFLQQGWQLWCEVCLGGGLFCIVFATLVFKCRIDRLC
jgi:hypothetical protein